MNGTTECFNCTLLTHLLPTLFHANLPIFFWEDAAANAVVSINLPPSRINPRKSSPFSLLKQQPVSYTQLRTVGCKCICLVMVPTNGRKIMHKGNECLYLWTLHNGDGWLVWYLNLKWTVKSHNIFFLLKYLQPSVGYLKTGTKDWFDWFKQRTPSQSLPSEGQLRLLWIRRLLVPCTMYSRIMLTLTGMTLFIPELLLLNNLHPLKIWPTTHRLMTNLPSHKLLRNVSPHPFLLHLPHHHLICHPHHHWCRLPLSEDVNINATHLRVMFCWNTPLSMSQVTHSQFPNLLLSRRIWQALIEKVGWHSWKKVTTSDILAGVLSKPLGKLKHQEAVKVLGGLGTGGGVVAMLSCDKFTPLGT